MSQEKLQTIVMQKSWGVIDVYYGIVQVVLWDCASSTGILSPTERIWP